MMKTPGMSAARKLGAMHGVNYNLDPQREVRMQDGLADIVAAARRDIDAAETRMRMLLNCAASIAPPGCRVAIRYLAQVIRTFPPEQVFAQSILAFELERADPRFVGLNPVAPEDDPVTLRDYDIQMRML